MEPQAQAARTWTLMETQALLDLIRDMGFTQILTSNGAQNLEVYETLCVLLGRCNIQVSVVELRSYWRALKSRFLSRKRVVDARTMPLSAVTVDFPFYEDMEQLLSPQSRDRSCRREADSSGLEGQKFPMSDCEDHTTSTSSPEAAEGAGMARGSPRGDVPGDAAGIGGPDGLVVTLCRSVDRLGDVLARLCAVSEQLSIQLGYICSATQRVTRQPYRVPSERRYPRGPAHNRAKNSFQGLCSRAPRRGLGRLVRDHP